MIKIIWVFKIYIMIGQSKSKLRIIRSNGNIVETAQTFSLLSCVETSRITYDKGYLPSETSLALYMTRKVF
jgi:hypothetical protein